MPYESLCFNPFHTFSNDNVQGTYAFCLIGQGGQGAVTSWGTITFSPGDGTFQRSGFVNIPAGPLRAGPPFPTRQIVDISNDGTYRVNGDGTGVLTETDPRTDSRVRIHIVITQTAQICTATVATEVFIVPDALDFAIGSLPSGYATRRRASGFTAASVQGEYAFGLTGDDEISPVAAIGRISFDGAMNYERTNLINVPERFPRPFPGRRVFMDNGEGEYEVNADGTGRLTLRPLEGDPNSIGGEGAFHFVITKNQGTTALEVCLISDNTDLIAGNLVVGTAKRR